MLLKSNIPHLPANIKRKSLCVTTAFIVIVILSILLSSILYIRSSTTDKLHQSLQFLGEAQKEALNTFTALNYLPLFGEPCQSEHLIQLRELVYESVYIKDIAYNIEDEIICTSTLGRLTKPLKHNYAQFTDAHEHNFWLNIHLDRLGSSKMVFLMQERNYIITVNPSMLELNDLAPNKFEIVFKEPTQSHHISGIKEMFSSYQQESFVDKIINFNVIKICSEESVFCAVTLIPLSHFFITSLPFLLLFLICLIALSLIFWFYLIRYFDKVNSLYSRVKRGLDNQNFYVVFQPIVDSTSCNITGCEVLARFKDEIGELFPDEFIPVIRELEATWGFTESVIIDGLKAINQLDCLPKDFYVNFNLFPCDVSNNAIAKLTDITELKTTSVKVTFEITEEEYLNQKNSKQHLDIIKESGFQLALDDFGTGYANLDHFRQFDFDIIKIDRSFIRDIEHYGEAYTLLKYLIQFAHEFNLPVVAEGVEYEKQHEILKDLGVLYCQGWLFGKPMDIHHLQSLINRNIN